MVSDFPLPDHFYTRELLILPLNAGNEDLLGAGTLQHRDSKSLSTINYRAKDYSGVLLLRGNGYYEDENGIVTHLERGSFFQRFPGKIHSTYPDSRGRWSEFYITLPPSLSNALIKTGYIDGDESVRKTVINGKLVDTMVTIKEYFRKKRPT